MLTYLRNGYYKITSLASYKAVTAPSELNEALTQESYQLSNAQLWQITSAGDGLYHIAPRSKSTYRMAAGDGYLENIIGTNGRNVEMREQQTDNMDEWELHYFGYHNPLREVYGFSASDAALINMLYSKVDNAFPDETELQRAWKCARLLGGLVYGRNPDDTTYSKPNGILNTMEAEAMFILWKNVAGEVFPVSEEAEEAYFVNTLGYSQSQYNRLKTAVQEQHSGDTYAAYSDFAHYQAALSARLAYQLHEDEFFTHIGNFCTDENVSYMGGWLGDATFRENGAYTTKMDNRDYCADLDAEISYRYILMGCSASDALSYYFFPIANSANRATIFLSYISYDTVCQKVFNCLGLNKNNDEHWEELRENYPDTYDFLKSLENKLETMGDY